MRDEAVSPPLGRHDARLRTAQAMLALGMDVEALALLKAAASDDPAADVKEGPALRAIAAGLSGRAEKSDAHATPPLASTPATTDEDRFWQAALRVPGADPTETAATLAATWKLALSYPESLRRVLLPHVADALLGGGQTQAAAELLKASPLPDLDLARAEFARANGHRDEALAGFDRVARSTDRDRGAKARRDAVELRLADHLLSPQEGAKALQSQVFAWRGDDRELELRLRVAALLEDSGAWRAALGALRDAEHLYPEAHDRLHEAQASLVRDLLKQDAASTMPPLELVALVGECADLLGESQAGAVLAPVLVDKLLALDLPERAEPILRRMIQTAPSPGPKAELGLRLAELLLAKGDAPGASSALETTSASDLTPDLASRRTLFKAKLLASIGDRDGALHLLDASDAPEALDQKAGLLEQGRDWEGAMGVLAKAIGQRITGTSRLSGAEADLVLRYASDAAQAGDTAALRKVREDDGARVPPGAQADLLRVLTQTPVRAVDDLPRAEQELAVARALPASFAGLQSR
jgi:tetratricopeptide (TPR) repeat protein